MVPALLGDAFNIFYNTLLIFFFCNQSSIKLVFNFRMYHHELRPAYLETNLFRKSGIDLAWLRKSTYSTFHSSNVVAQALLVIQKSSKDLLCFLMMMAELANFCVKSKQICVKVNVTSSRARTNLLHVLRFPSNVSKQWNEVNEYILGAAALSLHFDSKASFRILSSLGVSEFFITTSTMFWQVSHTSTALSFSCRKNSAEAIHT